MLLLSSADILIYNLKKNTFRNTIIMSNGGLDADKDRRNVGPHMGPNR